MTNKLVVIKNSGETDIYTCLDIYGDIKGTGNSPIRSIIDYGTKRLELEKRDCGALPKKTSRKKSKIFNTAPIKFKEYFKDFHSAEFEIAFNFETVKISATK